MATISTHTQGDKMVRGHNIRDPKVTAKEGHIDPNGPHEIWRDETLEDAFERIFGDAVRRYNAKQTRPERRIKNYLQAVEHDQGRHKKHPVYEMVPGVYPEKGECDPELCKEILKEYFNGWDARNPSLALIGAYWHGDEQGDVGHCHFDFVPVGHGYTRGMDTQCSLSKALEEMGFKTQGKNTAQMQWIARENAELERICREHGLLIEHPQRGKDAKHLEKDIYILEQKKAALEKTNDHLQEKAALEAQNILDSAKLQDPTDPESPFIIDRDRMQKLQSIMQHQQEQIRQSPQVLKTELEMERKETAEAKRKAAAKEKEAAEKAKAAEEAKKQADEATKQAEQVQEEAGRARRAYESKLKKFKASVKDTAQQIFDTFLQKNDPLKYVKNAYESILFKNGLLGEAKKLAKDRTADQAQVLDKMVDRVVDKMMDEDMEEWERER